VRFKPRMLHVSPHALLRVIDRSPREFPGSDRSLLVDVQAIRLGAICTGPGMAGVEDPRSSRLLVFERVGESQSNPGQQLWPIHEQQKQGSFCGGRTAARARPTD